MRPHTLDEMSTIIFIFCRDGANKIELIEKCYLNDIEWNFPRPCWLFFVSPCVRKVIVYDLGEDFGDIIREIENI